MTPTDYIIQVITLLGGLALFLFGMDYMGKSLERQAGGKLQTILAKMSSTPLKGFFLGMAVTAVIQSSSATTVMVVGFVNSGIMTLTQAVGVIMGSNVGTTVTAWILSLADLQGDSFIIQMFKPDTLAPLLGLIGIILFMFTKSERKQGIGSIFLGFMALMTGMSMMSDSMAFLKNEQWFADLMISFSNPILGVLAGALITAIIQSSSASVGILQSLCTTGTVTFGNAIPIIMGQNIGTCVTALISTFGATRNAKRTAMMHLYFNIIGVVLFMTVFYTVNAIIPWEFINSSADAGGIAIVHTTFNVLTTLVLLPLNKLLVKLATVTVRDAKTDEKVELLDERLIATPAVAVQRAREIAVEMSRISVESFNMAVDLIRSYDAKAMSKLRELENKTDEYEDALGSYLVRLSAENLSHEDNLTLNTLLYTIGDFERIADHAVAIAVAAQEIEEKPVKFSEQALEELSVLQAAVAEVLNKTYNAYSENDLALALTVEPQEQVVDVLVRDCKSRHIARLRDGKCTVEYGFVLDDLLTAFERIADHCSSIAVEMLQTAKGKMDAHEYLEALKAGKLDESREFEAQFEKQKKLFVFPE